MELSEKWLLKRMIPAKDLTNGSKITIIDLGTVSVSLCVFVPQHMPVNGTDAGVGIR